MCGIVFGRRKDNKPISKSLFKRYIKQKSRGSNGFGYVAIENGYIKGVKRFETQEQVKKELDKEDSSEILFHHRLPTSTENLRDLNHPIVVKNKLLKKHYYVVHNGVISNDQELREKHEKLGFEYTTKLEVKETKKTRNAEYEVVDEFYNDSECLAIEVALMLEEKQQAIETKGTVAFICIQTNKRGKVEKIHYGRNSGNPLTYENIDDNIEFIKSVGQGEEMSEYVLFSEDYETGETTSTEKVIANTYGYAQEKYSGMGFNPNYTDNDVEYGRNRQMSTYGENDNGYCDDWVEDYNMEHGISSEKVGKNRFEDGGLLPEYTGNVQKDIDRAIEKEEEQILQEIDELWEEQTSLDEIIVKLEDSLYDVEKGKIPIEYVDIIKIDISQNNKAKQMADDGRN